MQKSKPVILLSAMSPAEIRDLEKFIRSAYFNRNELLLRLFLYLKKEHPEMNGPALDREKIYAKVFQTKPFIETKLRYAFSDLTKLIERFIVIRETDQDRFSQTQMMLRFFRNRDLEKFFHQAYEESLKHVESTGVEDSETYYQKFLLEDLLYTYSSIKRDKSLDRVLQEVTDNLDYFYISKKLKYLCEMHTRQNFLNSAYHTRFIAPLLAHLKVEDYSAFPAIYAYHQVLLTLIEEDNEAHFYHLIEWLKANKDVFPREEQRDLFLLAQNYCTKKINQGHRQYLQEHLDLSVLLIDKALIFENGYLIPATFKNIVTVGLRLEAFDWTENFIYGFKDKVHPKYRENAFTYNLAWLHFFKGEYKKTLRLLSNVEYMDVYYILDSKILLLKTYFELEEVDAFYSLVDSFYVYLRRNELISAYQKNICLGFVKYVKRLMRARLGEKKAAKGLLEELNTTPQVASISWLLKKAERYPSDH